MFFSFSLDVQCLLLVGSSILLLIVVQQLVVILVLLQEDMSSCSGAQGASPVAPGKSGFYARGEGERVIVLESWEDRKSVV